MARNAQARQEAFGSPKTQEAAAPAAHVAEPTSKVATPDAVPARLGDKSRGLGEGMTLGGMRQAGKANVAMTGVMAVGTGVVVAAGALANNKEAAVAL